MRPVRARPQQPDRDQGDDVAAYQSNVLRCQPDGLRNLDFRRPEHDGDVSPEKRRGERIERDAASLNVGAGRFGDNSTLFSPCGLLHCILPGELRVKYFI